VKATDFDTAFAQCTVPLHDILRQVRAVFGALMSANGPNFTRDLSKVKEGGRIMTWAALHPKFNESFESLSRLQLQKAPERCLVTARIKIYSFV
jgi:hypothetical protein